MKSIVRFSLQITVAIFSALAIRSPVPSYFAQSPQRPPSSGETDRHRTDNERDLEIRIWNLRALSEHPRSEKRPPSVKQALAEMQKDFTRLQIVNKELLRVALGNSTLDPKLVLKSVSEIRDRAERLNKNLALPDPDKSMAPSRINLPAGPDHLKRSVMRLGTLIFSFVDNPFFKEISVVDTQHSTKARRDLEDIIELSGEIKKNTQPKN